MRSAGTGAPIEKATGWKGGFTPTFPTGQSVLTKWTLVDYDRTVDITGAKSVITITAREIVVPAATNQRVIPRTPINGIMTTSAGQRVIAVATCEIVMAATTVHGIVPCTPIN